LGPGWEQWFLLGLYLGALALNLEFNSTGLVHNPGEHLPQRTPLKIRSRAPSRPAKMRSAAQLQRMKQGAKTPVRVPELEVRGGQRKEFWFDKGKNFSAAACNGDGQPAPAAPTNPIKTHARDAPQDVHCDPSQRPTHATPMIRI